MFWISRQRKNIEEKDCFIQFFEFLFRKRKKGKILVVFKVKLGGNLQEMSKGLNEETWFLFWNLLGYTIGRFWISNRTH